MNLKQIKETIKKQEYDFLKENEHLGNNIILLTLGGSHAYGMDKEDSDLDVRGVTLNSKEEIIVRNIIEREYEFKCLNNYTLPFVLRKFNREEITENDKVFYHEGLLSKFMEVPNMEVKLNENKYSV